MQLQWQTLYLPCLAQEKKKKKIPCVAFFMSSGSIELHNGENDLATMCDSWRISHDSIAVDIMIASVPGAFQSCVFMMLVQRVSLVSLNYC